MDQSKSHVPKGAVLQPASREADADMMGRTVGSIPATGANHLIIGKGGTRSAIRDGIGGRRCGLTWERSPMARQAKAKVKKPTIYQSKILAQIAQSPLIKTYSADRRVLWGLANGREISEVCANALIRNGWVKSQRDGLGIFDDSQTYVTLKP